MSLEDTMSTSGVMAAILFPVIQEQARHEGQILHVIEAYFDPVSIMGIRMHCPCEG